jgi:hypothetical protein
MAAMQWDLGWQGVGLLIVMSLGFSLIARALAGRGMNRRLWPVAAVVYLVAGVFTSEVWFGWATEEELQPNIDGVSFDEVLLMYVVLTIVTIVIARYVRRRQRGRAVAVSGKPQASSGAGKPT